MRKHPSGSAFALAFFAISMPAVAAEKVPEVLRRQTQRLLDAITTGSAAEKWGRSCTLVLLRGKLAIREFQQAARGGALASCTTMQAFSEDDGALRDRRR